MVDGTTNGLTPLEKYFFLAVNAAGKNCRIRIEATGQDNVELSGYASDISRFIHLVSEVPDVREARVNEMSFAIESGVYNIEAEQVAQKIIGGGFLI